MEPARRETPCLGLEIGQAPVAYGLGTRQSQAPSLVYFLVMLMILLWFSPRAVDQAQLGLSLLRIVGSLPPSNVYSSSLQTLTSDCDNLQLKGH